MTPEPNWGNTHADDCPVTTGRVELWESFTQAISQGPSESSQRDYLWGAVIEWCAGGDEDHENCDCTTYRTEQMSAQMRSAEQEWFASKLTIHTLFNELFKRLTHESELFVACNRPTSSMMVAVCDQIDEAHHVYTDLTTDPVPAWSSVPRGAKHLGCTCGTPPFAPPEPAYDCPHHAGT